MSLLVLYTPVSVQGVTQASLAAHYSAEIAEQHPTTVQRLFSKPRSENGVLYLVFGVGKSLIKVRLNTAVERIIIPQKIAAYLARLPSCPSLLPQAPGILVDDAEVAEELAAPEHAPPQERLGAVPSQRLNVCSCSPS